MKKIIISLALCLLLTACESASVGIIGGADGPTDIVVSSDKWGLRLTAEDVTPTGMTVKFEQRDSHLAGELSTGSWFKLEKTTDNGWQELATNPLIDYAWTMEAYVINKNDITEHKVEWKWLYGELEPGSYRLSKEVMLENGSKLEKKYTQYNLHWRINNVYEFYNLALRGGCHHSPNCYVHMQ